MCAAAVHRCCTRSMRVQSCSHTWTQPTPRRRRELQPPDSCKFELRMPMAGWMTCNYNCYALRCMTDGSSMATENRTGDTAADDLGRYFGHTHSARAKQMSHPFKPISRPMAGDMNKCNTLSPLKKTRRNKGRRAARDNSHSVILLLQCFQGFLWPPHNNHLPNQRLSAQKNHLRESLMLPSFG